MLCKTSLLTLLLLLLRPDSDSGKDIYVWPGHKASGVAINFSNFIIFLVLQQAFTSKAVTEEKL